MWILLSETWTSGRGADNVQDLLSEYEKEDFKLGDFSELKLFDPTVPYDAKAGECSCDDDRRGVGVRDPAKYDRKTTFRPGLGLNEKKTCNFNQNS